MGVLFLVTCKKLLLTNKNIQDNFSLKSKKFPHASTGYSVCDQINSPKVNFELLNKRELVHPYRENPSKKQIPLDDICKPSFKVKFPFPNTPSPKGGGLRERSFIIIKTLKEYKDNLFLTKTFTFKEEYLSNHGKDRKRHRGSIESVKQVKEMVMKTDIFKKYPVGQAISIDKATLTGGLLKVWSAKNSKFKASYLQVLSSVSQYFLSFKSRLSVLKERRKLSDKPTLGLLKASNKALKGGERCADKTTTRVLSRGFLHNPQPFENTQFFPHLLRDHPSHLIPWGGHVSVWCVCVGAGLVVVVWSGLSSKREEGKREEVHTVHT